MSQPVKHASPVFTEEQMRQILARATELEGSRGGMVTANDLRKIAADAGIDSGALEQAMREATASPVPARKSDTLPYFTVGNLALVLAGAILGLLAIGADNVTHGAVTPVLIFAPSAAFAAWRAWVHRRSGSVRGFLREFAPAFGAFTAVLTLIGSAEGAIAGVLWSLFCGLGGVAIANRQELPANTPPAGTSVG